MFGIVNPPNASPVAAATTTVAQMMPVWTANSTTLASMLMYTNNMTMGTSAYTWGDSIDVANIPTWSHEELATNVMYTRLMFAANPGMLENGQGASNPNGSPVTIPADITQLAADSSYGSGTASSGAAANAGASATSVSAAPTGTAKPIGATSGAGVGASSSALVVGIIAVVATFMAL